jgi:asparagine synthase (glutamine-hydrolysing)
MCGIGGVVALTTTVDVRRALAVMSTELRHRGPDDEGFAVLYRDGDISHYAGADTRAELAARHPRLGSEDLDKALVGLVHRRFSIIDPSAAGHQPWYDEVSGTVLVFNGEIYNYRELRDELIALDRYPFISNSDTEVVAAAYREWGVDCFRRFNGFWAIAIVDQRRRELVLSRDRFGKKPLYYLCDGHGDWWFASELRALRRAAQGAPATVDVDPDAVFLYLAYDRPDTLKSSLWRGIQTVKRASFLRIGLTDGSAAESEYWQLGASRMSEDEISLDRAIDRFKHVFDDAVSIRLRADVPIAANLSGGMDSSAIVGRAQKILGDRQLTTHVIRYRDAPELDETSYAKRVADRSGTAHSVIEIDSEDVWNGMSDLIEQFEEPVHSPAFMTQWLGWKKIRETGTKVILHGGAADEMLAGYQYFPDIADYANFSTGAWREYFSARPPADIRGHLRTLKWFAKGRVLPQVSNPLRGLFGLPDRRVFNRDYDLNMLKRWFNPEFIKSSEEIHAAFNAAFVAADFDLGARMKADVEMLRVPFWVNAMDKSMMSIPVEVRMPFLDYRLVELLFSLPVSYIYRDGWTKYILRRAMADTLPESIIWRRNKLGFTVPKQAWYRRHRGYFTAAISSTSELRRYLNVDNILRDIEQVPHDLLWRATNLAVWLQAGSVR